MNKMISASCQPTAPSLRRYQRDEHSLEAARALGLDPARDVAQEPAEDVRALEVVDEARVLGFALLQQLVLVQDGLEHDVVPVEERVDRGRVREAEPGPLVSAPAESGGDDTKRHRGGGKVRGTSRTCTSRQKRKEGCSDQWRLSTQVWEGREPKA